MNKVLSLVAISALSSACSFVDDFDSLKAKSIEKDAGTTKDKDASVDGGNDAAVVVDCTNESDGTACGTSEGFVCLAKSCVASRCGDGFVDTRANEQCEPSESASTTCREDNCRWPCQNASDCDDGNACNGAEACDDAMHTCVAASDATDQSACMREGGESGVCVSGVCAPAGCGNGTLDVGEDCDPSVAAANGCNGCKWECLDDTGCNDMNACNGEEKCVDHGCVAGSAPSCSDNDNCTADSCAAEIGCVHTLIDLDGDGYSPYTCASGEFKGGDCADDDGNRNPGKSEQCDGIDNDCVGGVDNDVVTAPCYPDADGDGFPVSSGATAPKCKCDAGTIFARKDGQWDCFDSANGGASAFPGQTQHFTASYCKPTNCSKGQICICLATWDYDCDGDSEPLYAKTTTSSCLNASLVLCTRGWTGDAVPACGAEAQYNSCGLGRTSCSTITQPCK